MNTAQRSDLMQTIEEMSVLELAEFIKMLEDKFGVSGTPIMPSTMVLTPGESTEPKEEQTVFNVVITSAGQQKIPVIKMLRELVPTLGLKEAKDLVDAAPKEVLNGVSKTTAEEARDKLTTAGATVDLV